MDPNMRFVLAKALIAERLDEASRERLAAEFSAAAREQRARPGLIARLAAIRGRLRIVTWGVPPSPAGEGPNILPRGRTGPRAASTVPPGSG
jgi:hypothetical protein